MQLSLTPLQQVTLRQEKDPEGSWYPSRVVALSEGREIVVYAPHHEGAEVELATGDGLLMEVSLPQGIFRYSTRIRGRQPVSPPRLVLEWPEPVERIQRRDDVRVEVELPVEVTAHVEGRRLTFSCVTSDLSAGGVRLVAPEELPADTPVLLKIRGAPKLEVALDGRVLRSGAIAGPPGLSSVWLGVQFRGVSEADRKHLTKFVFDVQRERLRNRVD